MKDGDKAGKPYLFISFSSKDLAVVQELMADLVLQHIDFWDYSDIVQRIEAGDILDEILYRKIDECSHFIALISRNSVDKNTGRFCRLELEYALQMKPDVIIPVLVSPRPDDPGAPYNFLLGQRYLELDTGSIRSRVECVQRICLKLDAPYVPYLEAHPALPFRELFNSEIRKIVHENYQHVQLITILGEFVMHFKRNDITKSLFLIRHFMQSCEYHVPGYRFFYPWIVRAVCETMLDKDEDAMHSLGEAGKTEPLNQDYLGGKGVVLYKMGKYREAKACFEELLKVHGDNNTTNARINLVIVRIALGDPVPPAESDFFFDTDASAYPPDLQARLLNARAYLSYLSGDLDSSVRICRQMIDSRQHNGNTLVLLSNVYVCKGDVKRAGDVLLNAIRSQEGDKPGNSLLYFHLALLYRRSGDNHKAVGIFEKHLIHHAGDSLSYRVEYALTLKKLGRVKDAERVCRQVLEEQLQYHPGHPSDHYYLGLANYLLGREERARYDHERSRDYAGYYETL